MTNRSKTIGVRVTPEEYKKFNDFVEESDEFSTLSRFFRVIALRYIATDDEEEVSIDQEEITEAVDSSLLPITERLDKLEEHIISIDSNITDDDKIDKLARDIYSSLPRCENKSDLPKIREIGSTASDFMLAQSISTPYLWAKFYDEDIADTRRACARMLEYFPDVEFAKEEIESQEIQIPEHDDIDFKVNTSTSRSQGHTDVSTTPNRSETNTEHTRNNSITEGDHSTVRRYFKTEQR